MIQKKLCRSEGQSRELAQKVDNKRFLIIYIQTKLVNESAKSLKKRCKEVIQININDN